MTIHMTTKWFEVDATGGSVELFLSDILELDSGRPNGGFIMNGTTGLITVEAKDVDSPITLIGHPILRPSEKSEGVEVTGAISIDSPTPTIDGMDIHTTGANVIDLKLEVLAGKAKLKIRFVTKTR